jgi:hypothetical protein
VNRLGLQAGMDAVKKRKIFSFCKENPDISLSNV